MINLAVIPARGGSKGLPKKNILPLLGKPLIGYTIEASQNSDIIEHTLVSTDSLDIARIAETFGAKLPFIRPDYLATDTATSIDVLIHAVEEYEKEIGRKVDNVVLLQPTSPLRTTEHINEAFKLYIENDRTPTVSVCEADSHPYYLRTIKDDLLIPYLQVSNNHLRRQDLENVYRLNGAIYITSREFLINNRALYNDQVIPYIMTKQSSVDIDDRIDFITAEAIIKETNNGVE